MPKKIIALLIIVIGFALFFPYSPEKTSFTPVFRVTEKPVAITRGTYLSALTIEISFGDDEVHEWIKTLQRPYPLLFIDPDWAKRFPDIVSLILEKNIPVGLLGDEGKTYEKDTKVFTTQVKEFERYFGLKPLWFRTRDEVFPPSLHAVLWQEEINALGSTLIWDGGKIPPVVEGEILTIPHHKNKRVQLTKLQRLSDSRDFQTIEEVLFGPIGKTKKIPK